MRRNSGQSLVEIVIAIGIGAVLLGMTTVSVNIMLRSNLSSKYYEVGSALAQELMDNTTSVIEARWASIYNLSPKGIDSNYYLMASGTGFQITSGVEIVIRDGVNYTRSFSVENVSRDAFSNIVTSIGVDDPSTQRVNVSVSFGIPGSVSTVALVKYFTRWKNFSASQSDWSGGPGVEGPITVDSIGNKFADASSQIDFSLIPGSIKLNLAP